MAPLSPAARKIARHLFGKIEDGHLCSQIWPGPVSEARMSFAAEQDVAEASHHLDVEADAQLEDADVAGVHQQLLAPSQVALDELAGKIEPHHAGAAHLAG